MSPRERIIALYKNDQQWRLTARYATLRQWRYVTSLGQGKGYKWRSWSFTELKWSDSCHGQHRDGLWCKRARVRACVSKCVYYRQIENPSSVTLCDVIRARKGLKVKVLKFHRTEVNRFRHAMVNTETAYVQCARIREWVSEWVTNEWVSEWGLEWVFHGTDCRDQRQSILK